MQQLRRHGDIIKRTVGGYLFVQGRADDTMNLGGIKVLHTIFFDFLLPLNTNDIFPVKVDRLVKLLGYLLIRIRS